MSGILKMMSKTAVERRRIYLDYSCWLEPSEKLADFQLTVSPYSEEAPIAVDTTYPDETLKRLMMYVSGGVGNVSYTLSVVIRTDSNQVKRDDFGLRVYP
jgi:hypothetical protein